IICAIAGALYLFAFVMLSLMVKEGEYPPPPVEPSAGAGLLERVPLSMWRYMREVFFHPYYWILYLFYVCFTVGIRGYGQFLLPYATQTLKLDLRTYGIIDGTI